MTSPEKNHPSAPCVGSNKDAILHKLYERGVLEDLGFSLLHGAGCETCPNPAKTGKCPALQEIEQNLANLNQLNALSRTTALFLDPSVITP